MEGKFCVNAKVFPTALSRFAWVIKMCLCSGAKPWWSGWRSQPHGSVRKSGTPGDRTPHPLSFHHPPPQGRPVPSSDIKASPAMAARGKRTARSPCLCRVPRFPLESAFLLCCSEMCGGRAVSIPQGLSKLFSLQKRETSAVFCLPFTSLPWVPGKGGGKCVSGKWGGKLWCTLYSFSESFAFRQSKNSFKEQKPGLNSGPCLQQTAQLSDLWSLQCDGLRLCPFCFWRMSLNNLNLVVNYKITKQLGFLPSPCS